MLPDETKRASFTEFVRDFERRLRQTLTAAFGADRGKEATAEALAYGWEHWDRVSAMRNPAGYLYRVGYDKARRMKRPKVGMPPVRQEREPWVEPALPAAFSRLPEKQRISVALVHGYGWTLSEVAEMMDVSKATIQTHAARGIERLRNDLGVEL